MCYREPKMGYGKLKMGYEQRELKVRFMHT